MYRLFGVAIILSLTACVSTNERMGNRSEDTLISPEVERLLADNDGYLDTREHTNVRCARVRLVGTHRITKHCYTLEEDEAMRLRTQKELRRHTVPDPSGQGTSGL